MCEHIEKDLFLGEHEFDYRRNIVHSSNGWILSFLKHHWYQDSLRR